jgi:hypothetical protein
MNLPEPLRASAQHIQLLQDKRRRLSEALVSAELQFLAALRRECLDSEMTWAQLRDAYRLLSAARLTGLRARWMDAVPVSPENVILNARREAAGGAGGVWRGHRPLHRGEYYRPLGSGSCMCYSTPVGMRSTFAVRTAVRSGSPTTAHKASAGRVGPPMPSTAPRRTRSRPGSCAGTRPT